MGNVFYSPCLILSAATGHHHIPPGLSRPSMERLPFFQKQLKWKCFLALWRILWGLNFPGWMSVVVQEQNQILWRATSLSVLWCFLILFTPLMRRVPVLYSHWARNDARGANVGGTVTFFNTHSKVLSVSAHHDDGQQKQHNLIAGEENFNFAGNKNMARDSPVELIK